MKAKSNVPTRRIPAVIPDEADFAGLDSWAGNLNLEDGHPLGVAERHEEHLARSVGRPPKPESAKATRVMITMTPC